MLCWFFRLMISDAADSDKDIGRLTRRHAARCAPCRQFYQSCHRVETGLRSEATHLGRAREPLPPRIRTGLSNRRGQTVSLRAVAVAACIAIAGLAGIYRLHVARPAQPPDMGWVSAPAVSDPVQEASAWAEAHPTDWVDLIKSPLATEMRNIAGDAESSIRFLVACLSVNPVDEATVTWSE